MLSPLPRRSHWRHYRAHPSSDLSLPRYGSRVGLRIGIFEACSAFTRVTACTLALSPYFVTRLPEGFRHFVSSMPAPVLPAGAFAGWGLHPLESAALSRRTPQPAILIGSSSCAEADLHWTSDWLGGPICARGGQASVFQRRVCCHSCDSGHIAFAVGLLKPRRNQLRRRLCPENPPPTQRATIRP